MKYIFRGHIVFEYIPNEIRNRGYVKQHKIKGLDIAAFDYCNMIPEDYELLGKFFNDVYKHIEGEEIELKDINVV